MFRLCVAGVPAVAIYARRLVPQSTTDYVSPPQTFTLLFLSEGYTDETNFISDCKVVLSGLERLTPFKVWSEHWLTVYTYFVPSNQVGPSLAPNAPNTAFKSTYDQNTKTLSVDATLVTAAVQGLALKTAGGGSDLPATQI